MTEDEQYVKERYERVAIGGGEEFGWRVSIIDSSERGPLYTDFYGPALNTCWQQARAFTEAREREIAEVEEEINWLMGARVHKYEIAIPQRILKSREAVLADLLRGMVKR